MTRPRLARLVLPCLAAALLGGACASAGGLAGARGEGVTRYYATDFATLWKAIRASMSFNRLRVQEADRRERHVYAVRSGQRRGPGAREGELAVSSDFGERVAVFVDSVAPGTWAVEVITRRRFALDVTYEDWTRDVFQALEWYLADAGGSGDPVPPPGAEPVDSAGGGR